MKDTWFNHNTDKLMLFILIIFMGFLALHVIHHDANDMQAITFVEGAFSTVLGALILILTGRTIAAHPPAPAPPMTPPASQVPPPAVPGGSAPTLTPGGNGG
jgi:hypothetical protein